MQQFVKSSMEYIDQNLKTDITAEELANSANYSVGHFCRVFAETVGLTVAHYILKSRLDHALVEIASGRKAIDVVLEYGFNTYAGFYKAFVRMYGCSPRKYLNIYRKTEDIRMQTEQDIRCILKNWDIPQNLEIADASIRNWKTGEIEWNIWKIGVDYYLKTNERAVMINNIRIAKALEKEGLASEFLPVPTKDGQDYLDGKQLFLLTKKVGEPLNTNPLSDEELAAMGNNENRKKYAYQLGQAIAKIHRALKAVQADVKPHEANLYQQGLNSMAVVKEMLQNNGIQIEDLFFEEYAKTFGELYEKMPKQLIHGNPTVESVVYENGEPVGIKGYEVYNVSHIRLFDVMWCAGEINLQDLDGYLTMLKEILAGYNSISLLTEEEKQAIYYVLCTSAMNCAAYCGDALDVTKRNLNALAFLAKNKKIFENLI